MIDEKLLQILVCPKDQTALSLADDRLLAKVNRAIAEGEVRNLGGQAVTELLQGGLIREDRALLYPVVEDIPVLLVDEAISLDQIPSSP